MHLPRSPGVGRRLPSLLDRAIAPWCPGDAMHPHDIRLVVLPRHHYGRSVQMSVEPQHESAVIEVVAMPGIARRLVADHAQTLTGVRHSTPPFDQHAAAVLVRHRDGPDCMAGGV